MKYKVFRSSCGNVWKYVFTDDNIVLESVLYRYGSFTERTVICCSVQSGCPVGCVFCGTGNNFIQNIDDGLILQQIQTVLLDQKIDPRAINRFQIMFMSMGEPFLNYSNVEKAICKLNDRYPSAELLVSTVGIADNDAFAEFTALAVSIDKVGLQFSIHAATNAARDKLIPYTRKWPLRILRDKGIYWHHKTGRPVFLNYCVKDYCKDEIDRLKNLFSPVCFYFTFSVICEKDQTATDIMRANINVIEEWKRSFINDGYNARIFNPDGQDDIGGGCGQLWYVQKFLKGVSL